MADDPSIRLILPYFGPLPPYADLFLASCARNPSVEWLLITDQRIDEDRLPRNVAVQTTTFDALKRRIDQAVGMVTTLPTPYKLSDFRPAYGIIFAEELTGFDFWGHCDLDMIFGDIRKYLTPDILHAYNKVLIHGHLSLYRNCDEANNYFRLEAPGLSFRDVFTSPKNRAFDEFGGIRILLNHHRIPMFRDDSYLADINNHFYRMETVHPPNYRHQCFYWEDGRVFKEFRNGSGQARQEFLCIHLQKRPMAAPPADLHRSAQAWYIMPRGFKPKESTPDGPSEMDRLNPDDVLFGLRIYVISTLWHLKRRITRRFDPWPRGR